MYSLQEINTKLNEQIESQVRTLDRYMQKRADRYYNNCTQTEPLEEDDVSVGGGVNHGRATPVSSNTMGTQTQAANGTRDHSTNTIGCPSPALVCQQQHLHQAHGHLHPHAPSASSSTSSTANSTPNTSRPNSKQSGGQRRSPLVTAGPSKLPISQSDSTLSLLSHGGGGSKEEAQLLSSVRSMRVDLAIKNKAMQRLTRELDECKKTIRKLQRDKEGSGSGSQTGKHRIASHRFDSLQTRSSHPHPPFEFKIKSKNPSHSPSLISVVLVSLGRRWMAGNLWTFSARSARTLGSSPPPSAPLPAA